jgi:hypothetical protein|tara:strand:- start:450 stop:899 length:450 start_codon:yes stop_codon:yes gene_type:complete
MKNLTKKLEDLEAKIIETKNDKQRLREKVEKREKEIHQKVIKIWNKKALNDKSFHSDLNKIVSSFKKIDQKNKRYFWRTFEFDISKKETLKDSFAFFINHERVDFQINLNGLYTDLSVAGESFKIEDIQRAKEVYLNTIIDTFGSQNYL